MRLSPWAPESARTGGSRPGLTRPVRRNDGRSNPIRRILLAALVAAFFTSGTALAWQPGERAAQRHCDQHHPRSCLRRAALHFRIDPGWLTRVAICESRLDPYAHNPSGASGLMQFMPSTFAATRYGRHSIWSAKWSALAGGLMFSEGESAQWSCR